MDMNKAEQISNLYQRIKDYDKKIDSLTRAYSFALSYNDESSIHYEKLHSDVLFLKDHYIKEKEKLEKQLKEIK